MVKSRLSRIAVLEARSPVDPIEQAYPGLAEAVRRLHDALHRAVPPDEGSRVDTGPFSYCTVGYQSSSYKILDLGRRLRAGTETAEDLTVLAALPLEELTRVGVDARGFVEMLLSLDEKI
ncbi:hypothetical protein [Paraburkholderia sp. BL25I1N1]|uniref:hypothetical protein n=1 Tax=Paraburkholderia sp. BL25I1N1 TaxID=1938804 RepID=UPI000D082F57|nr:hypothetical protein [Paraburkholderia sp. BL25I1N1]PRY03801.1 hypothetical protein B0G73_114122 [Paraburkholderia sp. BL25I1N1]